MIGVLSVINYEGAIMMSFTSRFFSALLSVILVGLLVVFLTGCSILTELAGSGRSLISDIGNSDVSSSDESDNNSSEKTHNEFYKPTFVQKQIIHAKKRPGKYGPGKYARKFKNKYLKRPGF